MKNRRSKLEMYRDIINIISLKNWKNITKIMYKVNTNHKTLNIILNEFLNDEIIIFKEIKNEKLFKLTLKGLELRKEINEFFKVAGASIYE